MKKLDSNQDKELLLEELKRPDFVIVSPKNFRQRV